MSVSIKMFDRRFVLLVESSEDNLNKNEKTLSFIL